MTTPYIGEIRVVGWNFAAQGWALCNGQLLSIAENDALFALIGTTYGGDGQSTFALPNLQSRIPVSFSSSLPQGTVAGEENVTLNGQQIPNHTHPVLAANTAATSVSPTGNVWATWGDSPFTTDAPDSSMNAAAVGPAGGNQPHDNIPPYLTVNFIIALEGIFPTS